MVSAEELAADYVAKFDIRDWDGNRKRSDHFLASYPNDTLVLIDAILRHLPKAGAALTGLIQRLSDEQVGSMVDIALDEYERSQSPTSANAVKQADEYCRSALHPKLERIFRSGVNAANYSRVDPFRLASVEQTIFLRPIVEDASVDVETRVRAWQALLETRNADCIGYALAVAHTLELPRSVDDYLARVGLERTVDGVRQLYPSSVYKVAFDETAEGDTVTFGGAYEASTCPACGKILDRILTVDRVPDGLGISLPSLTLATCLQCLGWEVERFYYQHNVDGVPVPIAYDGGAVDPQFPTDPFDLRRARLVPMPPNRQWDSVTRLGGFPNWEQLPEYLNCSNCRRTMPVIMQVTSGHQNGPNSCVEFGDAGLAYGYWCDACRISGWMWQCT